MFSIITARSKNGIIGRNSELPWRLKADRIHLRNLTKDKTVILGRKTYDSMIEYYDRSGKTMPAKTYVVITRNHTYTPSRQSAVVVYSIDEALAKAKQLGKEAFFIGGAHIYELALPFADRLYITEIDVELEGDTFFPHFDINEWKEVSQKKYLKDDENEFDYTLVILDRV